MVMRSRSPPENSGMILASGVVSVSRPRSIAWNTRILVKALVTENRLNTESSATARSLLSLLCPNTL